MYVRGYITSSKAIRSVTSMHLKVQRAVGVDYKFYVTYYTVWGYVQYLQVYIVIDMGR